VEDFVTTVLDNANSSLNVITDEVTVFYAFFHHFTTAITKSALKNPNDKTRTFNFNWNTFLTHSFSLLGLTVNDLTIEIENGSLAKFADKPALWIYLDNYDLYLKYVKVSAKKLDVCFNTRELDSGTGKVNGLRLGETDVYKGEVKYIKIVDPTMIFKHSTVAETLRLLKNGTVEEKTQAGSLLGYAFNQMTAVITIIGKSCGIEFGTFIDEQKDSKAYRKKMLACQKAFRSRKDLLMKRVPNSKKDKIIGDYYAVLETYSKYIEAKTFTDIMSAKEYLR
jgi:hypothetical protein